MKESILFTTFYKIKQDHEPCKTISSQKSSLDAKLISKSKAINRAAQLCYLPWQNLRSCIHPFAQKAGGAEGQIGWAWGSMSWWGAALPIAGVGAGIPFNPSHPLIL